MKKSIIQKDHYSINPETGRMSITVIFGEQVAQILADKILSVYKSFPKKDIDTHMVFPLDLYKIRSMNETLEGLGENNNENE